jgi:hypothetical protein
MLEPRHDERRHDHDRGLPADLVQGDLTLVAADAIVNAANHSLLAAAASRR